MKLWNISKNNYSNIIFDNEICDAITRRQQAILNMDNDVEVLIVVENKRSNNCN